MNTRKRIGIVSLFNMKNVNFGNRLQALALNQYLRVNLKETDVESICLNNWGAAKVTNMFQYLHEKLSRKFQLTSRKTNSGFSLDKRLEKFNAFSQNNMNYVDKEQPISQSVEEGNYDDVIVGSDIVWGQARGSVNRDLFLDFGSKSKVRKISYAASFGGAYIPPENKKFIIAQLNQFRAISVRESSAMRLLTQYGVSDVKYVMDPTLLLSRSQWEKYGSKPDVDQEAIDHGFVFTYLLGEDSSTRHEVERLANRQGLSIITIPYANGSYNESDDAYDAIKLTDVSPAEWIWLIENATYVVTDSFHGTAFSTIFEKRYVVVKRKSVVDINERMKDFLTNTSQIDRWLRLEDLDGFEQVKEDYTETNRQLRLLIENSKSYIQHALEN